MTENIRRAKPEDTAEITAMIRELAEFERAADQCTVSEKQIFTALFGALPTVRGHIVEIDGQIAAMALWFLNFSTWDAPPGSTWKTFTCGRNSADVGWPEGCWRRWPPNAWTTVTRGCPGRC